ncbi:hypothetical protein [Paraliobacillus zengyii]|uniref:hypothetical protein n=1 Tax=Paraliobacillus zengyii TaxID=2213194 RepID=UPI000E3D9D36|nr:hypothetical protein [Paraliobacillus zengyii]
MKKWLFLLLVVGLLVSCGQQEDEASSNEQVNTESDEKVMEETSADSELEAEVSEEKDASEVIVEENDQEEESTESSEETEPEETQIQETTLEPQVNEQEIDIDFIKKEIKIGMTEQEIKELIGEPSKKGTDAMNAEPLWLYNIRDIKDYYFEQPEGFEEYGIVDAVDTEGLQNNEVEILLFISWKEDRTDYISAAYTNDEGEIKNYRLFEDGTVKES